MGSAECMDEPRAAVGSNDSSSTHDRLTVGSADRQAIQTADVSAFEPDTRPTTMPPVRPLPI
jgi:hypothetical protein